MQKKNKQNSWKNIIVACVRACAMYIYIYPHKQTNNIHRVSFFDNGLLPLFQKGRSFFAPYYHSHEFDEILDTYTHYVVASDDVSVDKISFTVFATTSVRASSSRKKFFKSSKLSYLLAFRLISWLNKYIHR